MKILQNSIDSNIPVNIETNFRPEIGWEEAMQDFEKETLKSIINPAVNFETVRYIHSGYTSTNGIYQSDIWYQFSFYNNESPQTHVGGLDYRYIGLTPEANAKVLRKDEASFFRLEFYKSPEGELPNSANRKLVFTKHLPIPLGERVFYTPIGDNIFVPVFTGSNYRNKENMYLFWFQDDTVLNGSIFSGDTFYMAVRFFNTIDGTTIPFLNKDKAFGDEVDEENDVYHKVIFDKTNYSYTTFSGNTSNRIGTPNNPIKFYAGTASSSTIV